MNNLVLEVGKRLETSLSAIMSIAKWSKRRRLSICWRNRFRLGVWQILAGGSRVGTLSGVQSFCYRLGVKLCTAARDAIILART